MAGMKRFVTYIYSYEDKKKGSNTGFAKIEIRGTDGRMEVHLRGAYPGRMKCRVYLFAEDAGDMVGVPLGEMSLQNGTGDFSALFKVENIGGMPVNFFDMDGIILIGEEQRILLSRWTEGKPLEVCAERFRVWEKPNEEQENQPETEQRTEQQKDVPKAQNQEQSKNEKMQYLLNEMLMNRMTANRNQTETQQSETGKKASEQTVSKQQIASEQIVPKEQPVSEQTVPQEQPVSGQTVSKEQPVSEQTVLREQPASGQSAPSQAQPNSVEEAEEENIAATEIPMRNIFPRYNWQQIWESLKANHEKFVLYREEEICCVKIELKDIRELPRRYWYLGNNSFLLHGFFNYRYLVVGEIGEERWFIGVPGVYQNQERVMAAIFGFPEFLPEPVENQFGYWCRMIEE